MKQALPLWRELARNAPVMPPEVRALEDRVFMLPEIWQTVCLYFEPLKASRIVQLFAMNWGIRLLRGFDAFVPLEEVVQGEGGRYVSESFERLIFGIVTRDLKDLVEESRRPRKESEKGGAK